MPQMIVLKATFTTAVDSAPMAAPGGTAFLRYGVQNKGVGGVPTTFTATLQGSLDNANWTDIVTCGADGVLTWDATGQKPAIFLRIHPTVVTLGPASAVNVTVIAIP